KTNVWIIDRPAVFHLYEYETVGGSQCSQVMVRFPDIDPVCRPALQYAHGRLEMEWRSNDEVRAGHVLAGIGDAPTRHPCEERQAVRAGVRGSYDVLDVGAARREHVRDERAVATPGHRLRTHQRDGALCGQPAKLREPVFEVFSEHVVGVTAE